MPDKPNRRGSNLTQSDRERGGRVSASRQQRDQRGQFAGARGKTGKDQGKNAKGEGQPEASAGTHAGREHDTESGAPD